MTLCQICFWLALDRPTSSDPLYQRSTKTHLPKAPAGNVYRELARCVFQWVGGCVSRVWVMSVVVTISVSVRASLSLSSGIRDVIGFWEEKKNAAKAPHPQTKRKFRECRKTRHFSSRLPEKRNDTKRLLCLVITLLSALLRIMYVVLPAAQASKSDRSAIYVFTREYSNYFCKYLCFV